MSVFFAPRTEIGVELSSEAVCRFFPDSMLSSAAKPTFVAFYWTYPVKAAGLISLPSDVDQAAGKSQTIRYQRDLVRDWVRERGQLKELPPFLEIDEERSSKEAADELVAGVKKLNLLEFSIILVDFSKYKKWRPIHGEILRRIEKEKWHLELIEPRTVAGNRFFDTAKHFEASRQRLKEQRAMRKDKADAALLRICDRFTGVRKYTAMAKHLNDKGLTTGTGRNWTGDNVRKRLAKINPNER